jgi:hypothetical protein
MTFFNMLALFCPGWNRKKHKELQGKSPKSFKERDASSGNLGIFTVCFAI